MPLSGIGASGQQQIGNAHVVLIGAGGLGCHAAQLLVSSGIGKITLCDFDRVTESNLARQVLYRASDVGRLKVEVATEALRDLNPETDSEAIATRMTGSQLKNLVPGCDMVIDASDNYGTRLAVNRTCLAAQKPWLMASCIRREGQIMYIRPDLPGSACYRCAYGQAPDTLEDCPGAGIFAPVAAIVGASAAYFALAHIAGSEPPAGLHLFDATRWQWQSLTVKRTSGCKDCAA